MAIAEQDDWTLDQERLKSYVRMAASCAGVLQAVSNNKQLPIPGSDRSIDMSMERNCKQLRQVMLAQIQARFANESLDIERWESRIGEGDGSYVTAEDRENDFDAASALLCGCMLSVNMLARVYYERFSTCEPLFTVIRRLTELSPPAMIAIFGDRLPKLMRQTWPHFTGLYEVHCSRREPT